jgi:tetratricopeptide (TPR) repeat protein
VGPLAFDKNKLIDEATRLVQKGALDKAIKVYLRIADEDPKDVRIWLKLGDLYAKRNEKALATETYLKVAEFYAEQGFYLKSVAVYKQILRLDTRLVEVNLRLAELYRQLGLLQDAMQQYEQVSQFYNKEGRTRESLAALRQIVELDPENVAIRIKLAELYSKEGLVSEAIEEFMRAADFLRAQNRTDDLLKVLERLSFHKPDDFDLQKDLARQYLERGDPPRALQKLQAAFKADPRDEDTLSLLAQAFQELGQTQKAVSVLRELAHLCDLAGDVSGRNQAYERLLVLLPMDPEALVALGRRATPEPVPVRVPGPHPHPAPEGSHGAPLDAEERLAHALTEADVYVKYGLHAKAVEHLLRVFDWSPDNVQARQRLKEIYLVMDRPAEAVEQLVQLGEAHRRTDPRRAALYFNEALDLDATHERARSLLGELEGGGAVAAPRGPTRRPVPAESEPAVEDVEPLGADDMAELSPDELGLVAESDAPAPPVEAAPDLEADSEIDEIEPEMEAEPEALDDADVWEEPEEGSIEEIPAEEALDLSPDEMDLFGRVSGFTASDLEAAESDEQPASEEAPEPMEEFEVEPEVAQVPEAEHTAEEPGAEPAESAARPGGVEEEIAEVDFFLQQSLWDDARDVLLDLERRHGSHALIDERRAYIEEMAAAVAAEPPAGVVPEEPLLPADLPEPPPVVTPAANVTVEDVVHEVQRAAGRRRPQEDPEAHYQLGVAYHEMGLWDDALREFDTAMRAGGRQPRYLLAAGRTLAERKQLDAAAECLLEGLRAPGLEGAEVLALNFELGVLYEKKADAQQALHHFEKVAMQEPGYRDVRARLDRLRDRLHDGRGQSGSDDFDRAFDDVFSLGDEGTGRRR